MDHNDSLEALTARQQLIFAEIQGALSFLSDRRTSQGIWADPENDPKEYKKPDSGAVMWLEAILCFLLPLYSLRERKDLVIQIYKTIEKDRLRDEVRSVLKVLQNAKYAFSGEPYISVEDNKGQPHPFIDTSCLTLSVILFSNRVLDLPATSEDKVLFQEAFDAAIRVIDGALIRDREGQPKGWFFTNFGLPDWQYKYCTWMATDTLSDISNISEIERKPYCPDRSLPIVGGIQGTLVSLRRELNRFYMEADLTSEEKKRLGNNASQICVRQGIVIEDDYDKRVFQFNVWIILTFLYLKYDQLGEREKQYMFDALSKGVEWVSRRKSEFVIEEAIIEFQSADFKISGRKDDIRNILRDRAALPQWIKALSIALTRHPEWRSEFGDHLHDLVNEALANRGKDIPVWDQAAMGHYSIYLTERYVEAFCKYLEYLSELSDEKSDRGELPEAQPPAPHLVNWEAFGDRLARTVAQSAITIRIGDADGTELVERIVQEQLGSDMRRAMASLSERLATDIREIVSNEIGERVGQIEKIRADIAALEGHLAQQAVRAKFRSKDAANESNGGGRDRAVRPSEVNKIAREEGVLGSSSADTERSEK